MFVACIKRLATEVVLDNFKSLGEKKKLSHAGGVTRVKTPAQEKAARVFRLEKGSLLAAKCYYTFSPVPVHR